MAKRKNPAAKTETRLDSPPDPFSLQTIYCGDNLEKLSRMPSKSVDLIYIDPPFNSNRNYEVFWGETKEKRAFEDRGLSIESYLDFMRPRCAELYRILKDTGSFYFHCDWHASHYVKVMLDGLFGANQFQNEIVWKRSGAHSDSKQGMCRFGRLSDSILFYTRGKRWSWNTQYHPYDDKYKKEKFSQSDPDGRRWNSVTLTAAKPGGDTQFEWMGARPSQGRYWAYTREKLDRLYQADRIHFTSKGTPRLKQYLDEMPGVPLQNVWTDIPPINSQAAERKRIGYPTQKPLPLLERIIRASSNPDDIVLDAFCGCGTALEAAQRLDRRWIGIDISPTACRVMSKRLSRECLLTEGRDFFVRDLPKTARQLRDYPHYEFENWAVNALNTVLVNGKAIANRVKVGDKGIDGRIYPVRTDKTKVEGWDLFGPTDDWLPVQVKQMDSVDRPLIDEFYAAMKRQKRDKGFFISFGFSSGAIKEVKRLHDDAINGLEIIPLTVDEILAEEVRYRV